MFQVWDVKGVRSPYIPGVVKARRQVAQTQSVPAIPKGIHQEFHFTESAEAHDITPKAAQPAHDAYERIQRGVSTRRQLVTAEQIMNSPVVTLGPDASFEQAAALIKKSRLRHVPIVENDSTLIGIISDRDLLRYALSVDAAARKHLSTLKVREIMVSDVISAAAQTEIREIARVMFEERIGAMPITNEASVLVGILTRSDILRALLAKAPLELWS